MMVKNSLQQEFTLRLNLQVGRLLVFEPALINFNSQFAFSENLAVLTQPVIDALFQLLFNEHLLEFLDKRMKSIFARQSGSLEYSYFDITDYELDGKISFKQVFTKDRASINLDQPVQLERLKPAQLDNESIRKVSYKNLLDFLSRKEKQITLTTLPTELRLHSMKGFKQTREVLDKNPLLLVYQRAKQLMEANLLAKIEEKRDQEAKEATAATTKTALQNQKSIKRKQPKPQTTKPAEDKPSSRINLNRKDSFEQSAKEKTVQDIMKKNRIIRIFAKMINAKSRFFSIEFSDDLITCCIIAFFEMYNLGKVNLRKLAEDY